MKFSNMVPDIFSRFIAQHVQFRFVSPLYAAVRSNPMHTFSSVFDEVSKFGLCCGDRLFSMFLFANVTNDKDEVRSFANVEGLRTEFHGERGAVFSGMDGFPFDTVEFG